MISFKNARFLLPTGVVDNMILMIERDRVVSIVPEVDVSSSTENAIDLEGKLVIPGFIDLQANGGGGVLFNTDTSVDAIREIGRAHARFGTVGFLPTLISSTREKMRAAISAVREAMEQRVPGVLGIHLEGPFLNRSKKGIHSEELISEIQEDDIELVGAASNGVVLLTVAPETVSTKDVARLTQSGVVLWGGHSDATYEEASAALGAGMTGFTHLHNAMSQMQSRAPGMVGAALAHGEAYVGLIGDGHHVHPAVIKTTVKAKLKDKVVLVTDSMQTTGTDQTTFQIGGRTVYVRDGRCTDKKGVLAGAHLGMIEAVRNVADFAEISFPSAVQFATENPSDSIGLGHKFGRIQEGFVASFLVLDAHHQVEQTWIDGVKVFDSKENAN